MRMRRQLKATPREIVYVDAEPDYGLKFYLNAEVERVNFKQKDGEETLEHEIAAREAGSLFVVRRRDEDEFLRAKPPQGSAWQRVGRYDDSVFYKPS